MRVRICEKFTKTSPSSLPTANCLSWSSRLTNDPIEDFEENRSSILSFIFPVEDLTRHKRPSEELQIKSFDFKIKFAQ
jgi:hypothetical protein